MEFMFYHASAFVGGDLSNWDTSQVTTMGRMFYHASAFNGDVSSWDTSNVTRMTQMFEGATAFNGDLSKWDTHLVMDFGCMFQGASSFNGDVSRFDFSSLPTSTYSQYDCWSNTDSIYGMFSQATSFNGDISSWNVSHAGSLQSLFQGATSFNIDLSSWDVSDVTYFDRMFLGASSFQQDLCWDIDFNKQNLGMYLMFVGSAGRILCSQGPAPTTNKEENEPDSSVLQVIGDNTADYWAVTKNFAKDLWAAITRRLSSDNTE